MRTNNRLSTLLLVGLGASGLLPNCNCEDGVIDRASVVMRMSFIEIDSCSKLEISRRIPDDYESSGLVASTDFGSVGEREFFIRSVGTAPLKISEVALSASDPEFTLEVLDAQGMPATLPIQILANNDDNAPPGAVIKVRYASNDAEPDLVELVVKTDDPDRSEVRFALSAGRGKLQVCTGTNCDANAAIDFADVSLGEEGAQSLVIKNVGEGDLDLRSVRLESSSLEFCAPEATAVPDGVEDCAPIQQCLVLKPGETYTVNVRYRPGDGGVDTGNITIISGDATAGNVVVPINGRGAGPALCVCLPDAASNTCTPATIVDFGLADVGVTATRAVRIESCGTLAVDLSEATLETNVNNPFVTGPEFTISTAFPIGQLAPGAFAEGIISYTPTGAGVHRGGLRYGIAGAPTPFWLPLVGQAATCDMEVVPTAVSFGTVAGGSQADRGVLLVNNGAKVCNVTNITDPNNSFSIVAKPATPFAIAAGASVPLNIRFAPPAGPVMPFSSSFVVTSDEVGAGANTTVQLDATGGGTPSCAIRVAPMGNDSPLTMRDGRLQFGAVNIGYDKTLAIRIDNVGNTDCTLQSMRLVTEAPTQFTATPGGTVPYAIPPGGATTISVRFAPTGAAGNLLGLYGGLRNYVEFTLAGPGLAQPMWDISINAQPTVPTIDVLPGSLDFGTVTWERPQAPDNRSSCGSVERSLNIYNSGTGALGLNSLAIDATSDPVFLITGVRQNGNNVPAPYNTMVQPGESVEVRLRFFPSRANPGGHQGLLVIDNTVTNPGGMGSPLTVPLSGNGTTNSQQTDIFQQLVDNKVDILWVVDDSGSMSEEQSQLANNFASFIGFADSLGVDYQVGVTTTEINDAVSGKLWSCTGYPKIITPGTPNKVAAFQCAANVTNPPGNTRPNPGGSDEAEAGLQAARLALDVPNITADNAGFLRPDARLAVIMVSDEEDQSPGSVNLYIDFFRNVKGFANPQLVSVSAIAGDVPNGCATAEAGQRYMSAVMALNGQYESVCTASWTALLNNIGLGVFALRTGWGLSRPADPSTIVVRVNGTVVPQGGANGWTFDVASNTLTFSGTPPPPGATIEVQYGSVCLP